MSETEEIESLIHRFIDRLKQYRERVRL